MNLVQLQMLNIVSDSPDRLHPEELYAFKPWLTWSHNYFMLMLSSIKR